MLRDSDLIYLLCVKLEHIHHARHVTCLSRHVSPYTCFVAPLFVFLSPFLFVQAASIRKVIPLADRVLVRRVEQQAKVRLEYSINGL